jgi:hypothetical protein
VLVYERIQTLLGREIDTHEMMILASVFSVNIDFF